MKDAAVPPGSKQAVVRDLAYQSEAFIDERISITMPPLMREIWRMQMKNAQQQVGGAFFGGGLTIQISYAVEDQSHDQKLMSMRGNNPHFNRATVHHELISTRPRTCSAGCSSTRCASSTWTAVSCDDGIDAWSALRRVVRAETRGPR